MTLDTITARMIKRSCDFGERKALMKMPKQATPLKGDGPKERERCSRSKQATLLRFALFAQPRTRTYRAVLDTLLPASETEEAGWADFLSTDFLSTAFASFQKKQRQ